MAERRLRASEIGAYVFCRRAWWYARLGAPSIHLDQRQAGERWHRRHGRRVRLAGSLRRLGYIFLLLALLAAGAYLAGLALG